MSVGGTFILKQNNNKKPELRHIKIERKNFHITTNRELIENYIAETYGLGC